jgi:hypothetical protein
VSAFAFAELVRRIERRAVEELSLEPRALPAELSELNGTFRGAPATLLARAYSGPRLAYVRFVEVKSRHLDIGNVLALPRAEFDVPVLGIDLVEVGRDTAMVVADLSPMTEQPRERAEQRVVLARHQRPGTKLGAASELPDWAREWFSDDALSARVSPAQASESDAAVNAYVAAFVELVRASNPQPERAELVATRQQAYAAAHRERDRGLLLLRRIFEPALAGRFASEVLFPEGLRQ